MGDQNRHGIDMKLSLPLMTRLTLTFSTLTSLTTLALAGFGAPSTALAAVSEVSTSTSTSTTASTGINSGGPEALIRKNLSSRLSELQEIDEVRKTPMPGIWEVRSGNDLFYTL